MSDEDGRKQLKVTMVSWDATDKWVITAVNDFSVRYKLPVFNFEHEILIAVTSLTPDQSMEFNDWKASQSNDWPYGRIICAGVTSN